MSDFSCHFSHAVVRKPGHSIVNGLRAVDTGQPDIDRFLEHHETYVQLLKAAGAEVVELEALEEFPDSVFVEDTALCLPQGAVIMRPGAPSRLDETVHMIPALKEIYGSVTSIAETGTIEGGDILTTEREILVGKSERTDENGIGSLRAIVSNWGYQVREFETPPGVLHFKTDCSILDENTILSTARLAETGCFQSYNVILTEPGEEACANSIRFNQYVIMPSGFPKTERKLQAKGYHVKTVGNSEAAKLDGGMSCLSLRIAPLQRAG